MSEAYGDDLVDQLGLQKRDSDSRSQPDAASERAEYDEVIDTQECDVDSLLLHPNIGTTTA